MISKTIITVIFLLSLTAKASKSQGYNYSWKEPAPYRLSWYLCAYESIVDASISKIGEYDFEIVIHDYIKGEQKLIDKLRIHWKSSHENQLKKMNALCLEKNARYIFILGAANTKSRRRHSLQSRWQRYIVKNDSLFLHYEILRKIKFSEDINIMQENTFNDPASEYGYKISLADFKNLVASINNSYDFTEYNCFLKNSDTTFVYNNFEQGIITDLDSMWRVHKCSTDGSYWRVHDYTGWRIKK